MSLVADNSLTEVLRTLTSLELYLNAEFYGKHPVFLKLCDEKVCASLENILCMSVSHASVDSGLQGTDLVKVEAVCICKSFKKWSGFISILSLSSVISRRISTYYPDFGPEKYKAMFNQEIIPRCSVSVKSLPSFSVHVLFCYDGDLPFGSFQHNHYVPLIFIPRGKRKVPKNVLHILPSKKTCVETFQSKILFKSEAKPTTTKFILPKPNVVLSKPLSNTSLFSYFNILTPVTTPNISSTPNDTENSFPMYVPLCLVQSSSTSNNTIVSSSTISTVTNTTTVSSGTTTAIINALKNMKSPASTSNTDTKKWLKIFYY